MTSLRQIDANRRNARLSTGPVTEEGKKRSRRNAVRDGLTAETVIDALEDAEDYTAFEMAITADCEAQSAVERELVLRLASLLWRLRRATTIESGLFKIQARQLLQFRQRRRAQEDRQKAIEALYRTAVTPDDGAQLQERANCDAEGSISPAASEGDSDDLERVAGESGIRGLMCRSIGASARLAGGGRAAISAAGVRAASSCSIRLNEMEPAETYLQ
jgi:hypothetical protein